MGYGWCIYRSKQSRKNYFTDVLIGDYSMVQPITSDGNEYLLVNGAQITPALYRADGQEVSINTQHAIGNRAFGVEIVG